MILGEKEKTLFGMVTQEMKLEIWTDEEYKGQPGIWNLCAKRGITNYFTGPLKRVIRDKPEKNENLKIYFASRTIMDDWKLHDSQIVNGQLDWLKYSIKWCKHHKIKTYVDYVWETITDYQFYHQGFKDSNLWKYFVDNDVKIVCHTSIDHPNLIDANRFFELEFTTTLYSDSRNHCSLYLKPKWYDEKKYFYCGHLGCVSTKLEIQRFLIHGHETGLIDDEFFWSVLNKRPYMLKHSPFKIEDVRPNIGSKATYVMDWISNKSKDNPGYGNSPYDYEKYKDIFKENTWESRTINYYDDDVSSKYKKDKARAINNKEDWKFFDISLERRISPQMMDSECYVVFENTFAYHTEKLMKPIYAQMPFIICSRAHQSRRYGEPNLLNANRRIKKLGYEIFEEVFDYSFEDKELNAEDMMNEFIKELIRVKKEGRKIWEQPSIKEKVKYNHYLLLKRSSTEEMIKYLYELFADDK